LGPNGWGGWSCPIGTTAIDGGYLPENAVVGVHGIYKEGVTIGTYTWPSFAGYTYQAGESGFILQNGAVGQELSVFVLCEPNQVPVEPTPTPLTCTGDQHPDGGGVNCVSFTPAGPPPQGPYTPPQGQVLGASTGKVLGASTLAGTGSFAENLYLAIMALGGIITFAGIKNFKKAI
jgi:hypothetical protein